MLRRRIAVETVPSAQTNMFPIDFTARAAFLEPTGATVWSAQLIWPRTGPTESNSTGTKPHGTVSRLASVRFRYKPAQAFRSPREATSVGRSGSLPGREQAAIPPCRPRCSCAGKGNIMFERVLVENLETSRRPWAVSLSVLVQSVVLGVGVLIPLVSTLDLPAGQWTAHLLAPLPPSPSASPEPAQPVSEPVVCTSGTQLPTAMPDRAQAILDTSEGPPRSHDGVHMTRRHRIGKLCGHPHVSVWGREPGRIGVNN